MNFAPITSSNLNAAAYEDGDLYLKFNNGSVYRYPDVPRRVYDELMSAESAGKYFHAAIRNQYEHQPLKSDAFAGEDVAA